MVRAVSVLEQMLPIQNDTNKILFEIEGLKTSEDNETYNPKLELENLQ